jgi:hypothetical protein
LIAVIVIAVLAGAVTAFILTDNAVDEYEAEVVVFLGQALPSDRSTFAVAPFAGDLSVLLSLDPVRAQVATASGVDAIAVDDLATEQIANGTAVSIRATAPTPEMAETVASEAARVGLRTLLEQEQDRGQRSLDAAELRLLEARADVEQFRGENGTEDPISEYRIAVDEATSLQIQLLNTGLTADLRASFEARQEELKTEIGRLVPLQPPYAELDRAAVGSETAVSNAKQELSETEALLAGAASGDFEVSTPAAIVSNRSTLIAGVLASMIVVVLLSILFFALIDRRKRNPTPKEQLAIGSGESPPGESPPDETTSPIEQSTSDVGDERPRVPSPAVGVASSLDDGAEQELVCVCGRVCLTGSGLSSHQRACEIYQQFVAEDATDPADADGSASSADPIWVLVPDSATADLWHDDRSGLRERVFENAGLSDDDHLMIVNTHGDSYNQIGYAEQAIAQGAAVIVLIRSESAAASSLISELAGEAGVRIVVESAPAPTDRAIADGNADNEAANGDKTQQDQGVAVGHAPPGPILAPRQV